MTTRKDSRGDRTHLWVREFNADPAVVGRTVRVADLRAQELRQVQAQADIVAQRIAGRAAPGSRCALCQGHWAGAKTARSDQQEEKRSGVWNRSSGAQENRTGEQEIRR